MLAGGSAREELPLAAAAAADTPSRVLRKCDSRSARSTQVRGEQVRRDCGDLHGARRIEPQAEGQADEIHLILAVNEAKHGSADPRETGRRLQARWHRSLRRERRRREPSLAIVEFLLRRIGYFVGFESGGRIDCGTLLSRLDESEIRVTGAVRCCAPALRHESSATERWS